jgi:hypothetical protein
MFKVYITRAEYDDTLPWSQKANELFDINKKSSSVSRFWYGFDSLEDAVTFRNEIGVGHIKEIDDLDYEQSLCNQGRGISCVKTLLYYVNQGEIDKARAVFNNEADKIYSHSAVYEALWLLLGTDPYRKYGAQQ